MFLPTNITLQLGDSGDFVTELQRRLAIVKCFNENAISGFFDGVTVNGVSQFQSMSGIRADGIAGPETLRRLNGALSGETGSTPDTKAEEEAKQQAAMQLEHEMYIAEHQPPPPEQFVLPATREAPIEVAQVAQETGHILPDQSAQASTQLSVQQQLQREMEMQARAQSGPSPSDVLAQMLLSQTRDAAPAHVQAPQQHAPAQPATNQLPNATHASMHSAATQPPAAPTLPLPEHTTAHHGMQAVAAAGAAMQSATAHQAAASPAVAHAAQHTAATPVHVAQQPLTVQAPAAPPEPRGIVGRAMQYANDMVQKLASHFEAKLPAPVLAEVKEIGQTMAKSGIKEATIPSGPEQVRGVDTPARGPQQQPQQSAGQLPPRH